MADGYSAMVSDRPYRKRLPVSVAKAELADKKGSQFDPEVADCFLGILERHDECYQMGEAADFKVAPDTKIYVWTKVWDAGDHVTVAFSKGDKTSKVELKVPHSPYRTHAYRTFRKGDEGSWTAKVMGADGTELGSATFTVAFN